MHVLNDQNVTALKDIDSARVVTLTRHIEVEEEKRKQLQTSLRDMDKFYRDKIFLLDEQNLGLLQQVEEKELIITKLKLELLHK